MNAKLFPNSWNTWDSLGEVLPLEGNTKEAIENYEKICQAESKQRNRKGSDCKIEKEMIKIPCSIKNI